MRFNRAEGDKKFFCNFLVGKSLRDQLQHFVLTLADSQPLKLQIVELKFRAGNYFFSARKPQPRPNTEPGKEHCHHTKIKFQGKIVDEVTVFDELQNSGQRRHSRAIEENSLAHLNKP